MTAEPIAQQPQMSGYGVGGPEWEPLPWSWAATKLIEARNLWVVTVSGSGRPHAMPVWGVWNDDTHQFAFSCAPTSRKVRNLAANPQVVVAPEDTVECLSVEGTAALVTDEPLLTDWVTRYLAKYQPLQADLTEEFVRSGPLYAVTPDRAFAVIEREDEFATRATRWRFG